MGIYTKVLNEQLNFETMINSIDSYTNLNESVNFKIILDNIVKVLVKFKNWIKEKYKYIKKEKEYNKIQKEKSSNNKSDKNEESKDNTFNEPIKCKFYDFDYMVDELTRSVAETRNNLIYPNSTKISDIDEYIKSNKNDNRNFSKISENLSYCLDDIQKLDKSEKILYNKQEVTEFCKSLKIDIDKINNCLGKNKETLKKVEDEILLVIDKLEKDITELKNNDINLSADQVNNLTKDIKETINYTRNISINIQKIAIEIDPMIKFNSNTLIKVQGIM